MDRREGRPQLVRGSDGRLRPADRARGSIDAVWAAQRRIQLSEAIAADQKQAARKRLRAERGLVGATAAGLTHGLAKTRTKLFGKRPAAVPAGATDDERIVEIRFSLPSLPRVRFIHLAQYLRPKRTRRWAIGTAVGALLLISLGGYHIWSSHASHSTGSATGASTNGQPPKLTKGTPPYHTMLPAGKTIEQLGGWTRISPPDRDPAYAYVDHIGVVQVDVSEQPLPANFEHDTASQVAQLAAGFNATDTLTAGSLVAYIGTSAKGPQSVIFAKGNLLILIKSGAVVPNDQWAAYLESLR